MSRNNPPERQPFDKLLEDFFHDMRVNESPPPLLLEVLQLKRPEPEPKKKKHWWTWSGLAVAIAALGVWGIFSTNKIVDIIDVPKGPGTTIQMIHARRSPQGTTIKYLTQHGSILHPHDFVQFIYRTRRPKHVLIASINQFGTISCYIPFTKRHSRYIRSYHGTLPNKHSLELDSSLGEERIYFFISNKKFSYSSVKHALLRAFQQSRNNIRSMPKLKGVWHTSKSLIIVKRPKP